MISNVFLEKMWIQLLFMFMQVYGRGSGADCRQHVQKLNALRGSHNQHQDEDAEFQLSLKSSHQEPNYINSEQVFKAFSIFY